MDMIHIIESKIGWVAIIDFQPMQPGDVAETFADIDDTKRDFGFDPRTSMTEGVPRFIEWYREYYGVK